MAPKITDAATSMGASDFTQQLERWARANANPIPSEHWYGRYTAEIRVSPGAEESYRHLVVDTRFPDGTWLVELLRDERIGRRGPVLALSFTDQTWRYWMLDVRGEPVAPPDRSRCELCHEAAPAAPVFGLASPTRSTPLKRE